MKTQLRSFAVLMSAAALLASCSGGDVSGTNSPAPTATPATAPNLNSCTEKVIDTGSKGTVAAVARGLYSDLKMVPGTSRPSVAFVDGGTLTLRFSYFDGTNYKTEIVAGDGAATFVKLAYLSSGRPMIFWSNTSTTLKAAFRSTAPGNAGSWQAAVIDTSTASRAVSVSVNALDEVAVMQLTNSTAAAGRARFLYCPQGCSSPTGFQTMAIGAQIESANVTASQLTTDIGWCKVSPTDYYPVVVYGGTTATRYAVCQQSSLSQCLTEANWTKQSVVATLNTSAVLGLDSTVTGDIPTIALAKTGTGIKTYKMGTTACTAAPSTFTESTPTLGSTTSGNSWLKLMKDPSGLFHLVANEGTASVRYYNTTSTDLTANNWSTAGVIDSVTLTAGTTGGGAIDTILSRVFMSYSQAAQGFNLVVSAVQNMTSPSSSAVTNAQYVDTTGAIQFVSSPTKNLNMRLNSSERPGVAYVDFSAGAATAGRLKFALRASSSASSAWSVLTVPNTVSPLFPDLAFDENDHPWISYFDQGSNRFFLATNSESDGKGMWTTYQFPVNPTGAHTLPATNSTAIVMDRTVTPNRPVMLVLDSTNAGQGQGLKASRLDVTLAQWTSVANIDALGASDATALSADADSEGRIVVAFYDHTLTRLRYITSADSGATWSTGLSIGTAGEGAGATIRLNEFNGEPAVAFYSRTSNKVLYGTCEDDPDACAVNGWNFTDVESSTGTSSLVNSGTNYQDQLLSASLAHFSDGSAYVTYSNTGAANARLITAATSLTETTPYTLRSGVNASMTGAAAYNHGTGGWNASTTISASGKFESVYVGPGNWLYSKTCGN